MSSSRRGFSLIEVMAALAVLATATLGLTAGIIVAVNANGISAKRTLMAQFAQARIERLLAETRTKIPTAATFPAMAVAGAFIPDVAPGTGGWMIDVIDGVAPPLAGNNAMFGPVMIADASVNGTDDFIGQTVAQRTATYNAWTSGGLPGGCGHPSLQKTQILCREVHIEPLDVGTPPIPMLRAWVRVVQGGTNWQSTSLRMSEDMAQ